MSSPETEPGTPVSLSVNQTAAGERPSEGQSTSAAQSPTPLALPPEEIVADELTTADPLAVIRDDVGLAFGTWVSVGMRPRLLRWRRWLQQITEIEPALRAESDADLRKRSLALRYRNLSRE